MACCIRGGSVYWVTARCSGIWKLWYARTAHAEATVEIEVEATFGHLQSHRNRRRNGCTWGRNGC
eukprot:9010358-Pyramimonas_sp.AAC.1